MVPISHITMSATERVTLGMPAAEAVSREAERLGARRVFILASRTLNQNTDEIRNIESALGARHVLTWDGIQPHVPRLDVLAATAAARRAEADLVVTVGGGSVTDAGKAILLCLQNQITDAAQFDAYRVKTDAEGKWLDPEYAGPSVRLVCVPTTLSGGEFSPLAGITDEVRKQKHGYAHRSMTPAGIVLDPAITIHTPMPLWLSTGVRSVDHATEALASLRSNDYCDGMAESALRLLAVGLPRVKADPGDLEARLKCQVGTWQSKIPGVSGVPMGASHAIGHVLGGTYGVPHGVTSCVMAPYVQAWNIAGGDERIAERQRRLAACLGQAARPAAELLGDLIRGLGMPHTLGEVGVGRDAFRHIAEYTLEDIWGKTNPRPLTCAGDVMEILEAALG